MEGGESSKYLSIKGGQNVHYLTLYSHL